MKSKMVAVIIAFSALTAALNIISIPMPINPYFSYKIGDIVLVSAFLLFGLKIGLAVGALNMLISITLRPDLVSLVGGPYYLVAILTMVLGICIFEELVKPKLSPKQAVAKSGAIATALGISTRTLIMLPIDYTVFGVLVSIVSGLSIIEARNMVLMMMPTIILYNITVSLYVIPISYHLSKNILKHTNIGKDNCL